MMFRVAWWYAFMLVHQTPGLQLKQNKASLIISHVRMSKLLTRQY